MNLEELIAANYHPGYPLDDVNELIEELESDENE